MPKQHVESREAERNSCTVVSACGGPFLESEGLLSGKFLSGQRVSIPNIKKGTAVYLTGSAG